MQVEARSPLGIAPGRLLRHPLDGILVGLSAVHGVALLAVPSVPLIALGLWWNANSIAHNFIHTPFFRARQLNALFSIFLSLLLGLPQSLWRHRHLRHHAGRRRPLERTWLLAAECGAVSSLWIGLASSAPAFMLNVYLPGFVLGLGLCFLQGHFEHAGGTTSHHGRLYNICFFNDGYHVEHHRRPGEHWTRLPRLAADDVRRSVWPPVLRWLDAVSLESLERIVLRSRLLQRLVLATHERALRALVPHMPPVTRVTIVGGGLFPRTALILRRLLPDASLTIVDNEPEHIEIARRFLGDTVSFRHGLFDPRRSARDKPPDDAGDAHLIVIPLAFIGDRRDIYRDPPAPATLVHDWIWNRRARSARVSWWLLKRLNLVTR
jgi:fatty acid desaturase